MVSSRCNSGPRCPCGPPVMALFLLFNPTNVREAQRRSCAVPALADYMCCAMRGLVQCVCGPFFSLNNWSYFPSRDISPCELLPRESSSRACDCAVPVFVLRCGGSPVRALLAQCTCCAIRELLGFNGCASTILLTMSRRSGGVEQRRCRETTLQ